MDRTRQLTLRSKFICRSFQSTSSKLFVSMLVSFVHSRLQRTKKWQATQTLSSLLNETRLCIWLTLKLYLRFFTVKSRKDSRRQLRVVKERPLKCLNQPLRKKRLGQVICLRMDQLLASTSKSSISISTGFVCLVGKLLDYPTKALARTQSVVGLTTG